MSDGQECRLINRSKALKVQAGYYNLYQVYRCCATRVHFFNPKLLCFYKAVVWCICSNLQRSLSALG